MNAAQLLRRIAAQMDEDWIEEEMRELALSYLNEAYGELMRIYRPYVDVDVWTEDGNISREQLGDKTGRVMGVFKGIAEIPTDIREDGAVAAQGGALRVRCRYIPATLAQEGDEPELPGGYHGALADYATARMMENGGRARQQRGEMYYARYLQRKATLAPEGAAWRSALIRKY